MLDLVLFFALLSLLSVGGMSAVMPEVQRVVVDVSRAACGPLELPATVGSLRSLLGGGEAQGHLPGRERAGAEVYLEEGGEFAGAGSVLEVPAAVGQT